MTPPKIYGLIGYPVKHSLSAVMHNAAFKALNLNAEYKLFEVKPEELKDFFNSFSQKNIYGLNVTVPYKVRVMEEFSLIANKTVRKEKSAVLAGAVNTVKIEADRWCYHNTDAEGFVNSLRKDLRFNPEAKDIFLFGCGGAGRAVIAGLMPRPGFNVSKIYIYEINKEARQTARKHFSKFDWIGTRLEFLSENQIARKIRTCDLLVNASPIGMKKADTSIIDKGLLRKELFVYDVVYNRETQLVKDAKSTGAQAVNGLGMLLYQGARAFEIWTGQKAPLEIMRQALKEALRK